MSQFIVSAADLDTHSRKAVLRGAEAKHCAAAARFSPGDPIFITDAKGHRWHGTCGAGSPGTVCIHDLHPLADNEPELDVELFQGLPKGDRWDGILEKGTELGVRTFRPLYTARSVPHLSSGRLDKRLDRWREKTRAALKQCDRSRLPEIAAPEHLGRCLEQLGPVGQGELRLYLAERVSPGTWPNATGVRTTRLAVGPEGGWTMEEQRSLSDAGFLPVSVGPRILRTDTAAVVGIALVMQRWGDLVFPRTEW
jgi:16S rRNA (uracil1498-N3)-methyltransferase